MTERKDLSTQRALGYLAGATILLTATAAIYGGARSIRQSHRLDRLREAWEPNQATFERLVTLGEELSSTQAALDELAGSWQCPADCSALVRSCIDLIPDDVEVGKIRVESAVTYNLPDKEKGVPYHEVTGVIAGRSYAENALASIQTFQDRLQESPAIAPVFNKVLQEGMRRIEGRENDPRTSYTVFAFRLTGAPHPVRVGADTP